ncbi:hypothetical protein [Actinoplanes sp. NPDC049802]|uniref:hypothetical protein n=1 Tax=Actinoplanes sp. NPDC049802 TaxID=3154742 RepID=UPI0033F6DB6B
MNDPATDYRRLAEMVHATLNLVGMPTFPAEILVERPGFEIDVDEEGEFAGVLIDWRTDGKLRHAALGTHGQNDLHGPARELYLSVKQQMRDLAIQVLTSAGFRAEVAGGYAPLHVRVSGYGGDAFGSLINDEAG